MPSGPRAALTGARGKEGLVTTASIAQPVGGGRWFAWPAIMMIASMATLVRAYVVVKLFFLALFLLAAIVNVVFSRTRIIVYRRLVWFYVGIGMAGLVWALVGVLHPANYIQGDLEALRLYVVWSVAFVVLYTLLRAEQSLHIMHSAMVVAGILIPLINFLGLYDQLSGLGFISEGIRQELNMEIGFGHGYFQFSSENIQVMFLIAPYLLSLQFRTGAGKSNSLLTKLALMLSLILVVISGRRALWLVVALTPCTVLLLSSITGSYRLMKAGGRRFLLACAAAGVIALSTLLIAPESTSDFSAVSRISQAFSSEDERTIQSPYLIRAFMESPILGSGFGGYAGYQRNEEKPWAYELTYQKLLFNMGIVGAAFLLALFFLYLVLVIRLLRRFQCASAIPFGLLVAFCSLLLGAYSNPYFSGFDSLFFLGLLPFLSTFKRGFDGSKSIVGAAV